MYGKRHGRWLKGDLEKTKYLGEICLNPNLPDLEERIKYEEKLIDVSIYYFKVGTQMNVQHYGVNLNTGKENKYYMGGTIFNSGEFVPTPVLVQIPTDIRPDSPHTKLICFLFENISQLS